jgi:hypothetical protein
VLEIQGSLDLDRMSKQRPNHSVVRRKGHGRHRRPKRFLAEALSIGIFGLLILLGTIGVPFVYRNHNADRNAQAAGARDSTGQIVMVGTNDRCHQTNFNNQTGQLSDGQSVPCPTPADPNKYEYPADRLAGIAKGFAKGQR